MTVYLVLVTKKISNRHLEIISIFWNISWKSDVSVHHLRDHEDWFAVKKGHWKWNNWLYRSHFYFVHFYMYFFIHTRPKYPGKSNTSSKLYVHDPNSKVQVCWSNGKYVTSMLQVLLKLAGGCQVTRPSKWMVAFVSSVISYFPSALKGINKFNWKYWEILHIVKYFWYIQRNRGNCVGFIDLL